MAVEHANSEADSGRMVQGIAEKVEYRGVGRVEENM